MQSIDGITQYQNNPLAQGQGVNSADGVQGAGGRPGIAMPVGSVFEGTITDVRDGQAVISLTNGQTMHARLESGVSLRPGEPMLFEVKSNQGNQTAIRPVSVESPQNPTLSKALTAAGLSVTDRNLSMVNAMMKNQMPVDKTSLQQMMRLIQGFGEANVETLVQMKKLGLPIEQEMIDQFQSYKSGQHALLKQFDRLMEALPEMPQGSGVGSRQLLAFHQQLLGVFQQPQGQQIYQEPGFYVREKVTPVTPGAAENNLSDAQDGMKMEIGVRGNEQQGQENAATLNGRQGQGIADNGQDILLDMARQPEGAEQLKNAEGMGQGAQSNNAPGAPSQQASGAEAKQAAFTEQSALLSAAGEETGNIAFVKDVLNEKQLGVLEQQLRQFPGMEENPILFQNGRLNGNAAPQSMLQAIQDVLMQQGMPQDGALKKLFTGKEYKSLLRQVMEQQWLLKPEDVGDGKSVEKLYQRMEHQMKSLESLLQNSGKEAASLTKNTASVRGNLEFMQQVNQLYNYIQIPLKLTNQNAHSDLYVYTNKKNLQDPEGELTALLHLELDHLGTTDVYVKMVKNNVDANFTMSRENVMGLVESHAGELMKRLEEKGYVCSVKVEKRQEEIDFVEDFLEREKPAGKLQRYSFDVMA